MKTYILSEDHGAYGPANEVEFRTTTLLSCSAIVMHNSTTRMLGLYHYGSLTLGGAKVQEAIRQMINDLQPTRIDLWPANIVRAADLMFTRDAQDRLSVKLDNAKLRQFLLICKSAQCAFEQMADRTFPGVSAAGGALDYDGPDSAEAAFPDDVGAGRTFKGNIAFFLVTNTGDHGYAAKIEQAVRMIQEAEMGERMAARAARRP